MHKINVPIPNEAYPIYVGKNALENFNVSFSKHCSAKQIAIVTTKQLYHLYGKTLKAQIPHNAQVITLFVPDGETSKSTDELNNLYTGLLQAKFERSSVVIALGGGVIGDLAGYLAATYLRGIQLIQVPTSLLAQVDSSIGGKTGINHPLGKNLIGSFKQPLFVYSDISVLKTLPADELRCGMGEVIKYAFIGDSALFEYLETHLEQALQGKTDVLQHVVHVAAQQKADVVARDVRESNLRMILNYGHTFGHALEAELGYGILKHGEAVILGMQCALYYAFKAGSMAKAQYEKGIALLNKVPISFDKTKTDSLALIKRMQLDKKVTNSKIRLILCDTIGHTYQENDPDHALIEAAFNHILK